VEENFRLCGKSGRASLLLFLALPCIAPRTAFCLLSVLHWRATMREISAEARLHWYARSLSGRTAKGLQAAALYSAFAVIAAVIFGTLSYHPF
jgi:hypothetical protein